MYISTKLSLCKIACSKSMQQRAGFLMWMCCSPLTSHWQCHLAYFDFTLLRMWLYFLFKAVQIQANGVICLINYLFICRKKKSFINSHVTWHCTDTFMPSKKTLLTCWDMDREILRVSLLHLEPVNCKRANCGWFYKDIIFLKFNTSKKREMLCVKTCNDVQKKCCSIFVLLCTTTSALQQWMKTYWPLDGVKCWSLWKHPY